MPSLLDLALMRQNPVGAGLLGIGGPSMGPMAPSAGPSLGPMAPSAGPSLGPLSQARIMPSSQPAEVAPATPQPAGAADQGEGSFFQKLFAGGNDPNLSPEENDRLRREAMLTFGLDALSGLGERDAGIPGLARSIQTGRQFAAGAKVKAAEAAKVAERERMRADILERGDLSTQQGRVSTVRNLLAAGFGDEAGKIIDVMGEFEAPQLLKEGESYRIFDPDTREITDTGVKIPPAPGDTDFQQVGDTLALIDKQSGEWIAQWSNPERLSAAELRSLSKDAFDQTTGLRKEFQAITEAGQEAIALADAAAEAPLADAAGGQTLVIALNKILDPNSVVRESEFARVNDLGGYVARLEGMRNKFDKGQIGATAEAQIRAEIARLRQAMAEGLSRQATYYRGLADENGLNPDQVVRPSLVDTLEDTPEAAARRRVSGGQ